MGKLGKQFRSRLISRLEKSDVDLSHNFIFSVRIPAWKDRESFCHSVAKYSEAYEVYTTCIPVVDNAFFTDYMVHLQGSKKDIKFIIALI